MRQHVLDVYTGLIRPHGKKLKKGPDTLKILLRLADLVSAHGGSFDREELLLLTELLRPHPAGRPKNWAAYASRFVAGPKEVRRWLAYLWLKGEYLYASNGHIAVRVSAQSLGLPATEEIQAYTHSAGTLIPTETDNVPASGLFSLFDRPENLLDIWVHRGENRTIGDYVGVCLRDNDGLKIEAFVNEQYWNRICATPKPHTPPEHGKTAGKNSLIFIDVAPDVDVIAMPLSTP